MRGDVLDLAALDGAQPAVAGGKGARLGALAALGWVRVPPGFCITADVYRRIVAGDPAVAANLDALTDAQRRHPNRLATAAGALRSAIEAVPIPADVRDAVDAALDRHGAGKAYAVRSSATAEDLPSASFAGQQDSFLNVIGLEAVLAAVRGCWASLFSERAVRYRVHQRFDHRRLAMAVVVQELVEAEAAGVLFTADPVTGDRRLASVEAGFGLGEALVSGLVQPDVFAVRDGRIESRAIATKASAVRSRPGGGTEREPLDAAAGARPSLDDDQVLELVGLGRRIEAHLGAPQDIEWCRDAAGFAIVQSRPITALFPVPAVHDERTHVYLSVGHQQMMTDAMRPLGLSLFQLTALRPMVEAGGRLFVDVTDAVASPPGRAALSAMIGRSDPLMGDALAAALARADRAPDAGPPGAAPAPVGGGAPPDPPPDPPPGVAAGPAEVDAATVAGLVARTDAAIATTRTRLEGAAGPEVFERIAEDLVELRALLVDPQSMAVIMAGMDATWWLDEQLQAWLGEKGAADVLTRSAPGNVTSEMGLALLDVADAIRPHPEVVAHLRRAAAAAPLGGDGAPIGGDDGDDDGDGGAAVLDGLTALPGGEAAHQAFADFLDRYGMRCIGEIDITRPRWAERPTALVHVLLGHVEHATAGEARRRFEVGRREAEDKAIEVLAALRVGPDGRARAAETERMIARLRTCIGFREYPKFGIISRYWIYKQAILGEVDRLVAAGVLARRDDAHFLRFEELHEAVRTGRADRALIEQRRRAHLGHRALHPPRVLTSDGLALLGSYHRDDLPAGALVGLAVSAGVVEGRARVVRDVAEAVLEPGDILVTAHTDPSWSPLFVTAAGLVTEVGGRMTHGAVIAREYGLPAVVGVEHATRRISDGRRLRVHGTDGYVELLPDPARASPQR